MLCLWTINKTKVHINERMEIELINFKSEVAKRFNRSLITEWTFPRKQSEDSNVEWQSKETNSRENLDGFSLIKRNDQTISTKSNSKVANKSMADRWKTIDSYYQKKIAYKQNKNTSNNNSQAVQNGKQRQSENGLDLTLVQSKVKATKIRNNSSRSK